MPYTAKQALERGYEEKIAREGCSDWFEATREEAHTGQTTLLSLYFRKVMAFELAVLDLGHRGAQPLALEAERAGLRGGVDEEVLMRDIWTARTQPGASLGALDVACRLIHGKSFAEVGAE